MSTNPNVAMDTYNVAVVALKKFCEEQTELEPYILTDEYPIRVQFIPCSQMSLFDDENIDENGEVNELMVTVGLISTIRSTLRFKMDSKLLKKLIKLAENVGRLYYQAYREQQGARNTPRRPFMKAMDGFSPEGASALVCPGCEHPIVNRWAPGTKPNFCQGCGQAIDWTPEPAPDTFEDELKKLRKMCLANDDHPTEEGDPE